MNERWLSPERLLPRGGRARRVARRSQDWQLFEVSDGGRALVARRSLVDRWAELDLLPSSLWTPLDDAAALSVLQVEQGYRLEPVDAWDLPAAKSEALAFALALATTRSHTTDGDLSGGIYNEKHGCLLPTASHNEPIADRVLLGAWLSGGVHVDVANLERVSALNGALTAAEIADIAGKAGIAEIKMPDAGNVRQAARAEGAAREVWVPDPVQAPFELVGREGLAAFLREHVIEVLHDLDRYRSMGVDFPGAVALSGPPGCGKTFAVEALVRHLDWPCFEVSSASIASPYIHETGRKIADVFDAAAVNAPAVVVIDEMEAWLADRGRALGSSLHHVEEIGEFLRRVPAARASSVLVFGMTNQIDLIDPAMLRRGRFDHVIEVEMPSASGVEALLRHLLRDKPIAADLELSAWAERLVDRPLSDVAFVVREAARLSARSRAECIATSALETAIAALPPMTGHEPPRSMGFRVG